MTSKDFCQDPERVADLKEQILEAEELIEELDVEATSSQKCKPRARVYRIRVDRHYHRIDHSVVSGREILTVAGKTPATGYLLFQVFCDGKSDPVGLDETVDLSRPGIEKFRTLPRDQTEG